MGNKNKNRITTPELKITITEQGLKVNREIAFSGLANRIINALLAVTVAQTTEENRESLYQILSVLFSNALASYAPDLYFPDHEDLVSELEKMAEVADEFPDNTEQIEEAKAIAKSHIVEEDAFRPGETVAFDESGHACYEADDNDVTTPSETE